MWYILKIEYEGSEGAAVKMHGCSELAEAQRIFAQLEIGYLLDLPVRALDDKMIRVRTVRLFECFNHVRQEAFKSVESGGATVMQEARAIPIDF